MLVRAVAVALFAPVAVSAANVARVVSLLGRPRRLGAAFARGPEVTAAVLAAAEAEAAEAAESAGALRSSPLYRSGTMTMALQTKATCSASWEERNNESENDRQDRRK